MNRIIVIAALSLTLSGCSVLEKGVSMIPSFWDDNQSARIIDIRQGIEQISCEPGTQLQDAEYVMTQIEWFKLYSQSKGSRQQDVIRIISPMEETVKDWLKRSQTQEGSKAYCQSKRMILKQQSKRAAESILGRF
jgi:hypothetical protein